jgi:hypothetical protein
MTRSRLRERGLESLSHDIDIAFRINASQQPPGSVVLD